MNGIASAYWNFQTMKYNNVMVEYSRHKESLEDLSRYTSNDIARFAEGNYESIILSEIYSYRIAVSLVEPRIKELASQEKKIVSSASRNLSSINKILNNYQFHTKLEAAIEQRIEEWELWSKIDSKIEGPIEAAKVLTICQVYKNISEASENFIPKNEFYLDLGSIGFIVNKEYVNSLNEEYVQCLEPVALNAFRTKIEKAWNNWETQRKTLQNKYLGLLHTPKRNYLILTEPCSDFKKLYTRVINNLFPEISAYNDTEIHSINNYRVKKLPIAEIEEASSKEIVRSVNDVNNNFIQSIDLSILPKLNSPLAIIEFAADKSSEYTNLEGFLKIISRHTKEYHWSNFQDRIKAAGEFGLPKLNADEKMLRDYILNQGQIYSSL
tara:strand:+ start:19733 stop:20878 length:1146 start_codon:yes stop_codon:yes gene_type:complete